MNHHHPLWQEIRGFVRKHETKVRFVLTGGINTALGVALFPSLFVLLAPFHIHYMYILVASIAICVVFAFITNKFFVFRTSGNYLQEFGRFVLFHISHFALSLVAVPLLVEVAGISPMIAQPFFAVAIVITSYFWHRRVTFVPKRHQQGEVINPVPTKT